MTNNNIGIAGVSWFCKLMNIRAGFRTTAGGYLEDDDVSSAIIYASDNGAQIISISWGDKQLAPVIRDACQYAYSMDVAIIASAGNEGGVGVLYPAALDNTISVTAIDENLSLCSFSSYGEGIDLCAPGLNILSTYLYNDYRKDSGTSMSSPFVSGAVAVLLSQNPLLINEEIYDLLKISCDDLGDKGYDNQFGYGIINIEKLLINATEGNKPDVKISFPKYGDGFYQDFSIIGTAYCLEFFNYSLTFTDKQNPEENDWLDIITHNPTPTYYYNIVINDTLTIFNTAGLIDSTYYLRLSVKDYNGNSFVDIIKFCVDKSPSGFIENTTSVSSRYNFDKENYYILTVTDEPVRFKATCFSSDVDSFSIIENKFSRIASLKLPDNLPDTQLSFFIEAINKSNLCNTTEIFTDSIHIDNSTIATRGFEKLLEFPNAGYLCSNNYDINNNGKQELVFMEFPKTGTYGDLKFCEVTNDTLEVVDTMEEKFLPWSIGDSNGDGIYEILVNIADSMLIYESSDSFSFPSVFIGSISNSYCGSFYDLNNDGKDEILVRSTTYEKASKDNISHYDIYFREGNNFIYSQNWLCDNTPTHSKNELTPRIQFGDLYDDGKLNILLSDIDGDILIYEVVDFNCTIELVDTLSIPIYNAYYDGIGDFDGDGINEFIVGGYNEDIMNPDNQLWFYVVFGYVEDDQYEMIDYTEISGVSSKNGLCIVDLDNDGADEIVIAASPDIYIYKLIDGKLKPTWVGNSYRSFYPVFLDIDGDGITEIAFNQYDNQDSLRLVLYHYPNEIKEPSPQNFCAIPLDKNSVRLSWRPVSDIDSFKIYRTSSFDSISFYLDESIITYIDTNVISDSSYFYQVSAINNGIESYKTLNQLAIPTDPPTLTSIKMISLNALQLDFDNPLNQSCLNLTNYKIDNIGYPESVISLNSGKGVLLTFNFLFTEYNSPYIMKITNIEGRYHTPMTDTIPEFIYEEDIARPYIKDCIYINKKEIQIKFNESIKESSATNLDNYELIFPEDFEGCVITDVIHNDKNVTVKLSKSLKPTSKLYFIKVNNIEDLSGNLILPGKNFVKISLLITNLDNVQLFPNPFNYNEPKHLEKDCITFQNLPTSGKADIYIYNFTGEQIKKISKQLSKDYNTAEWNLRNSSEKKVASGIYFYMIKYSDKFKKGKIAIIR